MAAEIENSADLEFKKLYNQRWGLNYGDTDRKETPEFWNERAADFAAKAHSEKARRESEEFLQRFTWRPDETVLDVAAGPGTFAVPLARQVASVTATDFSGAMLDQLQKQAESEKISNIRVCHGRWLEMKLDEVFDTVLCLNSLGVIATDAQHQPQLEVALKKLAQCTGKRLILLIPHADSPLEPELRGKLGLEQISLERRRIAILYLAMIDCGMLPSLNIIRRPFRWTFVNLEEAVDTLLLKAGIQNADAKRKDMTDYLQNRLVEDDSGRYSLAYEVSQALYVWEKSQIIS
ncbi:MAG: class I SAM-dependent methyltransferase [Candidatus Rifleibacteriota bacterium]